MLNKKENVGVASMSPNNPRVVAVVGMSGSGKSEVVRFLVERLGGTRIYFGGVVIEEIERQGRIVTEESEADVRMALRGEHGMEAMAKLCLPKIHAIISSDHFAIVDGLYSYSEYKYLQGMLGQGLLTLAVHTPFHLRVERLANREVRPLSIEEIHKRDAREIETMEKGGPIALADFHVVNDRTLKDLQIDLERCVQAMHSGQLLRQGD